MLRRFSPSTNRNPDEYEAISTRTLAIERFKRNHELMADVFTAASKGENIHIIRRVHSNITI